jgi:hypothetical protein
VIHAIGAGDRSPWDLDHHANVMGIPTTEHYAAMLEAASAGGYAYPAVNVTSSQTLNAVFAASQTHARTGS